jgi:sugar phosphate isomerase/epimerase
MTDGAAGRELALACLAFLDATPEAHILAAAGSGFDHVTLRVTGSEGAVPAQVGLDPARVDRVRSALEDSGVGLLDVEVVRMDPELDLSHVAQVLEVAAVLGARNLLVVNSGLEQVEAIDRLGEIVSLAAGTGVRPCLEPMRFSRCRSLAEAVATAVPAGAGVLIDALHLFRAGEGPASVAEAVRRHGRELFPYAQVCDAPTAAPGDVDALRDEAVKDRRLPGDGDIPLAALLSALPSDLPLAVEAPTLALRTSAPQVRARWAMTAVRGLLA